MVESDFNYSVAAEKINQNKSNVAFLSRKFGFSEVANQAKKIIKANKEKADIKQIVELHNQGLNVNKIAKMVHRTSSFVINALNSQKKS